MLNEHDEKTSRTEPTVEFLYGVQVRDLEEAALFLLDADGRLTTWNRGVKQLFGYHEEEWIGQPAHIIFTEEDRADGVPEAEMRNAREQGTTSDVRWHRRKDGTRVYVVGVMKALFDQDGNLSGYTKIATDDTERKLLQEALARSNADLQQFAYLASHDMQEPLRTISTFADLLERRHAEQLGGDAGEFLRLIRDAAQRMGVLIRDLLAYSALVQDGGRMTFGDLDEDLETSLSLLRSSIEESGAVITHDPLPRVTVDHASMARVFQNLVGNAIKFRKPGEAPHVHVWGERDARHWTVRVRDNGIGFSGEHAAVIFQPFKRLHSAQEYSGTGIGLAACKRIVERHGGTIGAESQPGEGSTFWFTLPDVAGR